VRKESSELREVPSPKHLLAAPAKTWLEEAEETDREPTRGVQKEAERGDEAEQMSLNKSLISQGFPGLSRTTSLWHCTVQLPMVCRIINNETNTGWQCWVRVEVKRVLREGKDESTSRAQRG